MHGLPLLQCSSQCTMETVLQIQIPPPGDDMGEEVAVEGRILLEQCLQIEGALGGHQLIQPDLMRCDGSPLLLDVPMVGVRADITHALEDHRATLSSRGGPPEHRDVTIRLSNPAPPHSEAAGRGLFSSLSGALLMGTGSLQQGIAPSCFMTALPLRPGDQDGEWRRMGPHGVEVLTWVWMGERRQPV